MFNEHLTLINSTSQLTTLNFLCPQTHGGIADYKLSASSFSPMLPLAATSSAPLPAPAPAPLPLSTPLLPMLYISEESE